MQHALITILAVVTIAFCALVIVLIPMVQAMRRSAESLTSLQEMIQQELRPTIRELSAVLSEIRSLSKGIAEHTDDVKCLMSALGETGSGLRSVNRALGTVTSTIGVASMWIVGAKALGKHLVEKHLKKRGGN